MSTAGPRVAVIGAGWAGLACARLLQESGVPVRIFEATKQLGGRARGLEIRLQGQALKLDNGQHLIIGAYRAVRTLLKRYANDQHYAFKAPNFSIRHVRGGDPESEVSRFSTNREHAMALGQSAWMQQSQAMLSAEVFTRTAFGQALSRGLAQLSWLAGAQRIPYRSLIELASLLRQARVRPPQSTCSIDEWLQGQGFREQLVNRWIDALCESALNCPRNQACALRLSTVLNEAMASAQFDASHWMQQACDLGELLAQPLAFGKQNLARDNRFGALDLHEGKRVLKLRQLQAGERNRPANSNWWLEVAGQEQSEGPYEHIVMALEPQQAAELLARSALNTLEDLRDALGALPKPLGILTRWLLLPKAKRASAQQKPQLLLQNQGPAAWLFPRACPAAAEQQATHDGGSIAGLVISAQHDSVQARRHADEIQQRFEIQAIDHKDIYEHRAATPSTFGTQWPSFDRFRGQGLWLAGDWVDDGGEQCLPASLESALRSASACAEALSAYLLDAHHPQSPWRSSSPVAIKSTVST